jgi:hypothetical protein
VTGCGKTYEALPPCLGTIGMIASNDKAMTHPQVGGGGGFAGGTGNGGLNWATDRTRAPGHGGGGPGAGISGADGAGNDHGGGRV